jgi:hypothetical protein
MHVRHGTRDHRAARPIFFACECFERRRCTGQAGGCQVVARQQADFCRRIRQLGHKRCDAVRVGRGCGGRVHARIRELGAGGSKFPRLSKQQHAA